jgi:hypothetical protein
MIPKMIFQLVDFQRFPNVVCDNCPPFVSFFCIFRVFETGSLLEIVAEREEGDARPQLIASLLHNYYPFLRTMEIPHETYRKDRPRYCVDHPR